MVLGGPGPLLVPLSPPLLEMAARDGTLLGTEHYSHGDLLDATAARDAAVVCQQSLCLCVHGKQSAVALIYTR